MAIVPQTLACSGMAVVMVDKFLDFEKLTQPKNKLDVWEVLVQNVFFCLFRLYRTVLIRILTIYSQTGCPYPSRVSFISGDSRDTHEREIQYVVSTINLR